MHKEGAGTGNGFVLYNLNMDDGNSSQSSAPSAPSPYSLGPAQRLPPRTNFRAAPPPHTAVLRTNFTTGANGNQAPTNNGGRGSLGARNDPSASPDAGFQDIHTPHPAPTPFAQATPIPEPHVPTASTISMLAILVCIVLGLTIGWLLNHYEVDSSVTNWVRTPGDLYVRAVQCIVVPLVFVNLAVAVADLVHIGKANAISARVALFFVATTLIGVLEGIGMGFLARVVYDKQVSNEDSNRAAQFGIQCSNGNYLEMLASGLVTCTAKALNETSKFLVEDVNHAFVPTTADSASATSLSLNLIAIFELMVPANIMAALVNNTLLSIVAFAIPTGVMLTKSFHGPIQLNPLLEFLREVNDSLLVMANWVLRFTPVAVLSLLAGSFGTSLASVVTESPVVLTLSVSGLFIAAVLVHVLIVMPVIFTLTTRSNPFAYMRHLLPAYVYAVGCASSAATLPTSMHCIEQSREVVSSVMYFVMSIGASLNKNGTAIYLPMMVFYLVDGSGLDFEFDAVRLCVLALASFLGALAAAPVPGGSLVLLTTVWKITFPTHEMPQLYALLVAADVVLDRLITFCNVHGDTMVTRIISAQMGPRLMGEIMRNHEQPMIATM